IRAHLVVSTIRRYDMPVARKMTSEEVAALTKNNGGGGARKAIEAEDDALLSDYAVGEYGINEIGEGGQRATVRNRRNAAGIRRGVTVHFIKTKGNSIRFKVEEQTAEESVLDLFGKAEPVEA